VHGNTIKSSAISKSARALPRSAYSELEADGTRLRAYRRWNTWSKIHRVAPRARVRGNPRRGCGRGSSARGLAGSLCLAQSLQSIQLPSSPPPRLPMSAMHREQRERERERERGRERGRLLDLGWIRRSRRKSIPDASLRDSRARVPSRCIVVVTVTVTVAVAVAVAVDLVVIGVVAGGDADVATVPPLLRPKQRLCNYRVPARFPISRRNREREREREGGRA